MTGQPNRDAQALRRYTRWTKDDFGGLSADLVGSTTGITARPETGLVYLLIPESAAGQGIEPDHARLIGVRLIEAAALADAERAIRESS